MAARVVVLAAVLAGWAGAALGEAPSTSVRPMPRPVSDVAVASPVVPVVDAAAPSRAAPRPAATASVGLAPATALRPKARPAGIASEVPPPAAAQTVFMLTVAAAGPSTPRPRARPSGGASAPAPAETLSASAAAPAPERKGGLLGIFGGGTKKREPVPKSGYVCGDPDLKGEELARITSKVKGCGIEEPVRVVAVDGIRLSTPATIDCTTASALKKWVQTGLRPAFGQRKIVELGIAASYICRPRNNVRGNKISEHGRGKAVDISGIVFADGKSISVAKDYGREFRRAHKAACGTFGTTLGPGSDGYHEDHLHFDTASSRSGPYCR